MDNGPIKCSVHEGRLYATRIVGTGAADPTVEVAQRITVTRVSAGLYRYQFPTSFDAPGVFVGAIVQIGAATPSDIKGYSFIRDTYDTTNKQVDVAVFNSSGTATDLAALQYMDVWFMFAEAKSP